MRFLRVFLTTTKKYYEANLFWVDFKTAFNAVRDEINTWVEEKTNNKIKDLIPADALSKWTRFVLVNAIYFKGTWASQFQKHNTKDASFWPEPEKEITVPMMHQTGYFQYTEDESLQIVELPYEGREISMLILLPKKDVAMTKVEKGLTTKTLNKWISNLSSSYYYVSISMPKYKVTSKFTLNDNLKSMGVLDAFSKKAADFSGMANLLPDEILYISAVIHKAFVDVNEEGTEAAAATAVVFDMGIISEPPPPKIFNADHPFLFLIRDNATGSILFFGRVVDPTI